MEHKLRNPAYRATLLYFTLAFLKGVEIERDITHNSLVSG